MNRAMKCRMRIGVVVASMMFYGMLPAAAQAQASEQEAPLVISGKMPFYPLVALHARIEGVVKIKVTTDGRKVISLDVESGPPMLVAAAKESILSWEFVKHTPMTFLTKFTYAIEGPDQCMFSNGTTVLNLPLDIRISAKGLKTCDPAAEIKSHQ